MAAVERNIACPAAAILALALLAGCESVEEPAAPEAADLRFERENEHWRSARLARLTEPYGWLSLVGLEPIDEGAHTVGRGADNDIVVDDGPERWGEIRVSEGEAEFVVGPGAGTEVTIDGEMRSRAIMQTGESPTFVQGGRVRIQLITPGDRLAVRIRDPEAPTRTEFEGLDYFELDPDWRVEAEFQAHPDDRTIPIANVLGQLIDEPNPGRVVFEYGGRTHSLEALESGGRLFFIFADRTSGRETYGLGRFLYADLPENDRVVLDFNQAYNPPCAFTAYTTCPLPPPENRLDVAVTAGEKAYSGPTGIRPEEVDFKP